tara:strand:+ start:406 stop:561 length:156 start_codon:yes stop_codon:yes gene_type:complete
MGWLESAVAASPVATTCVEELEQLLVNPRARTIAVSGSNILNVFIGYPPLG